MFVPIRMPWKETGPSQNGTTRTHALKRGHIRSYSAKGLHCELDFSSMTLRKIKMLERRATLGDHAKALVSTATSGPLSELLPAAVRPNFSANV